MVGRVSVDEAKRRLRAEMREVRRAIAADPADRAARSARIWAHVVASVRGRVMLYESLPGEPDTGAWVDWCRAHGHDVFLPEVDGPALRVMPGDVDPASLDVVVVPGLAFAADGRRLGQGGGHYDRFLPRLRADSLTIGVCYHEQIVDDLPSARNDVRVQRVVTD
jgi:5-formyltetrahydrofolate cyclo-ligase